MSLLERIMPPDAQPARPTAGLGSWAQIFSWPDSLGASSVIEDYCPDLAKCSPDGVNYDNVVSSACVSGM
jgi:hypothetical protein